MDDSRQLVTPEHEASVRQLFDLTMTPEEFAARRSHEFQIFSWHEHQYNDPELDAWIQCLARILFSSNYAQDIAELRDKYLTPEEKAKAEAYEADPF